MNLTNGVHVEILQQTKFKDITITLRFRNALEQKKASARSLLALMMIDRCKKYDTKQAFSECQDRLYGASVISNKISYGKTDVFSLRMSIINPMYLEEDNTLINDSFAFLHEIVFEPLLNEDIFYEQKQSLLQRLQRAMDEPSFLVVNYALRQFHDLPLGINCIGTYDSVSELTLQDVKDAYHDMMHNDIVDILICGDVDETIIAPLKQSLPFTPRNHCYDSHTIAYTEEPVKKQVLYRDITQSYICMLWFTNCNVVSDNYFALSVANAILGRYSTSLLFQEVREKRSLCYSIDSNIISYDGVLGVTTGVDKENIDETIELIHKQYEKMCFGYFDDNLLEVTKKMLINSFKSSQDSQGALISMEYENILLDRKFTYLDYIEHIQAITKEDVMKAMQQCEFKSCTILTKEDEHE